MSTAPLDTQRKAFEPKRLCPCPIGDKGRIKRKEKAVSCECGSWFCIISDLMD